MLRASKAFDCYVCKVVNLSVLFRVALASCSCNRGALHAIHDTIHAASFLAITVRPFTTITSIRSCCPTALLQLWPAGSYNSKQLTAAQQRNVAALV
jgi:hypothetical protein